MVSSRFPFSQLQRKHQLMNVPLFRHLILSCYGLAKVGDAHVRFPDGYRVNRNYILYYIYISYYVYYIIYIIFIICMYYVYIYIYYVYYIYMYVYNCIHIYIYVFQ